MSADVHIDGLGDAIDVAGARVLPDVVFIAEVQGVAVLGDPGVVLADVSEVQRVVEPACIGVHTGRVAGVADGLAECDGAGGALGGADGIGAAGITGDFLGIVVDAQGQRVAADQAHASGQEASTLAFVPEFLSSLMLYVPVGTSSTSSWSIHTF